jgi:hypothetical protein
MIFSSLLFSFFFFFFHFLLFTHAISVCVCVVSKRYSFILFYLVSFLLLFARLCVFSEYKYIYICRNFFL